jgi:hypothetical protein
MALLTPLLACGVASDADRRLLPGQGRAPAPTEVAYLYLAWSLRSTAPCERISPDAYTVGDFGGPSRSIRLLRSRCYAGVAANTRDPAHCADVQSASSLFTDGSDFSRERCEARSQEPRNTVAGRPADIPGLMRRLGWNRETLHAECAESVESRPDWTEVFRDYAERCAARDGAEACAEHTRRRALEHYFRDAHMRCREFYSIAPDYRPVDREPTPEADLTAWYAVKLRTGEPLARLDRLPDFSRN